MSKIISEETKRSIIEASAYIATKTELAAMYGVSDSYVGRLLRGEVPVKKIKSPKVSFDHPTERLKFYNKPTVESVSPSRYEKVNPALLELINLANEELFKLQCEKTAKEVIKFNPQKRVNQLVLASIGILGLIQVVTIILVFIK